MYAKCFVTALLRLISISLLAIMPVPARAWTEFLSMDVVPESAGWTLFADDQPGSSSVVNGGILTLTTPWYREYRAPASWLNTVSNVTGYTIEFRMRIVSAGHCYYDDNIGVWYYDNSNITVVCFDPDLIYVHYPTPGQPSAPLDVTQWHTYRIVVVGTRHQIFVDDNLTLDYQHPGTGLGTPGLYFGDLGVTRCGPTQTEWDYLAYDTHAVVPVATTSWGKIKALYRNGR